MEILIWAGIAAAIGALWFVIRFFRYQRDPAQYELAELLAQEAAAEHESSVDMSSSVALFVMGQGWSKKDASRRLMHALALVAANAPEVETQARSLAMRAIEKL